MFFELQRGGAGVVTEGFHHFFHGRHLFDDGVGGAGQYLRVLFAQFVLQFPSQPFGGELDGGERVADFVCQPFRHFPPCGFFLRPHEQCDVVENEHRAAAVVGRKGRGLGQQDACFVAARVGRLNGFAGVFGGEDGLEQFG